MRDGGDLEYFLRIYDVVFTVQEIDISKNHSPSRYTRICETHQKAPGVFL